MTLFVVGSGDGSGVGSGLCAMDHQLRYVDRIDGVEAAWTPPNTPSPRPARVAWR
jgi:hypothetical protein